MTNVISPNITYAEAVKSATATKHGIDNTPSEEQLYNMRLTAKTLFEPLRKFFKCPILVSSFFRSKKLNSHKDIGGSKSSSHIDGLALDLKHSNRISPTTQNVVTNAQIFAWLYIYSSFDQLIWEYGDDGEPAWVHVSLARNGNPRRQVLIKRKGARYVAMEKSHIMEAISKL